MEKLFENNYILTEERYLEISRPSVSKLYYIYGYVALIGIIGLILASIVFEMGIGFTVIYICFAIFFILYLLVPKKIYKVFAKRLYEQEKALNNYKILEKKTYIYEDKLEVVSSNGAKYTLNYNNITKLHQTENFIILSKGKEIKFAIQKDGFIKGTYEDFERFISSKLNIGSINKNNNIRTEAKDKYLDKKEGKRDSIASKIKDLLTLIVTNPVVIVLYLIFSYKLIHLLEYGRYNNDHYIVLLCTGIMVVIFLVSLVFVLCKKERLFKVLNKQIWKRISTIIMIFITLALGFNIYTLSKNHTSKLSRLLYELKTQTKVAFESNNIFDNGINGIFEDINKKYELPKNLYLGNDVELSFDKDGTITNFYAFLYGIEEGISYSYLISYNIKNDDGLTLRATEIERFEANSDKLLQPLLDTVEVIPLKDIAIRHNEETYSILYKGKRVWHDEQGVVKVRQTEDKIENVKVEGTTEGYTVSVYIPGKEHEIIPYRYHLENVEYKFDDYSQELNIPTEDKLDSNNTEESSSATECYLENGIGYKLHVEDGATGQFLYSLQKTRNAGQSWEYINSDAFNGPIGRVSGMVFFDESLGYVISAQNGGDSTLFLRTTDGGDTFSRVNLNTEEVPFGDGETIKPYDTMEVPYIENGIMYVVVGQGLDGDYKGGNKVLYSSLDQGDTWKYEKEIDAQNY